MSYGTQFENMFTPHLEVLETIWIKENKSTIKSVVDTPEREEIKQNQDPLPPEVTNSVSYEIRNITPKKHFWRK